MDNTENNKLIAEFMGLGKDIETGELFDGVKWIYPEDLLYNSSWGWLMPVVEKIDPLVLNTSISKNGCHILRFLENGNRPLNNANFIVTTSEAGIKNVNTKLTATYKAVVEFIKWYNENKL